jgi:hypothetical protein
MTETVPVYNAGWDSLSDGVTVQLASALDIGAAALVTHGRDFSKVLDFPVLTGLQSSQVLRVNR